MKSRIKVIFYLILFFAFFVSDGFTAKKKSGKSNRRSASSINRKSNRRSAGASLSASSKAKSKKSKSNSKSKVKDKSKGDKTKSKTDSDKSKEKEDQKREKEIKDMISKMSKETLELTENSDVKVELACLNKDIDFLIGKDCKFLLSGEMKKDLKDPFFCVYQDKPSGKIESVYDYYFYQNYGVKESSVKQTSTVVKVKNNQKGAGKYYQYLLDGISKKTLKEAKILDFLTEKILDEMTVSSTDETAISAKNVDITAIAMDESLSDIEHCKKETKKVMETCGVKTNQNVKKIIGKSCEEYESLLVKQTSKLKADVLDKGQELLNILKERTLQKAESEAVDKKFERKLREAEEEEEDREAEREEKKRKAKAAKKKDSEKDNEKKSDDSKKDDGKKSDDKSKDDPKKKDESKDGSDKQPDKDEKNGAKKPNDDKGGDKKPDDVKKPDAEKPADGDKESNTEKPADKK